MGVRFLETGKGFVPERFKRITWRVLVYFQMVSGCSTTFLISRFPRAFFFANELQPDDIIEEIPTIGMLISREER